MACVQLDTMRQDYLTKMRMLREDHEEVLRQRDKQLAQLQKEHAAALQVLACPRDTHRGLLRARPR